MICLQTHLLRKPLKNKEHASALHSYVYSLFPEDALITENDICEKVLHHKENDKLRSRAAVGNVISDLVRDDMVVSFHGIKLEKLLNVKL